MFACALAPLGAVPLGPGPETATDGELHVAVRRGSRARIAQRGALLGVGEVRLDARADLEALVPEGRSLGDLELVLAAFEARGDACLEGLLGDFALVLHDARARVVVAARDPFGVKALYARGAYFASHARLLAEGRYDEDFVAGLLTGSPDPGRTMWRSVRAVRPGSIETHGGGRTSTRVSWSAARVRVVHGGRDEDRAREIGHLLRQAITSRVGARLDVHAQLSGGLDSSSIVCLAAALAKDNACAPLAGTHTYVDTLGASNEEPFSDEVARACALPNAKMSHLAPFSDDGRGPPLTDHPWMSLPFYAHARRVADRVRRAGGRVLLSGHGGDHVLDGPLVFLAGEPLRAAARDLLEHAIVEGRSIWELAWRDVVRPLLGAREVPIAPWVTPALARAAPRARLGFSAAVAGEIDALPLQCEREPWDEALELRYPFLDRRVVEACLALPPRLRVRPGARKWALREAMRGVLPEAVRTRTTKCGPDARVAWSLADERARIDALATSPLAADLGWIDAAALRRAIARAREGRIASVVDLANALALEMWLRARHRLRDDSARADGRQASDSKRGAA
jgi:asparagine synthase (glutamine-hydrolysing)